MAPHSFQIDAAVAGLSTARLTPDVLAQQIATLQRAGGLGEQHEAGCHGHHRGRLHAGADPARLDGRFRRCRPSCATLSAAICRAGAGQTIYLIDAYDHPNAFSDLAKFSTKFGLPACTSVALTASTRLPLASAGSGCTFSIVYTDSSAALKSSAPAYNASWIAEIALDTQWAHAIAPLARIVLIEVADANSNSLLGGVALANKMGAGVVSMSFGAAEGAWVKSTDASFTATGMTYVASSGDAGAQVLWPAVSPHVLAVGGTRSPSGNGTLRSGLGQFGRRRQRDRGAAVMAIGNEGGRRGCGDDAHGVRRGVQCQSDHRPVRGAHRAGLGPTPPECPHATAPASARRNGRPGGGG